MHQFLSSIHHSWHPLFQIEFEQDYITTLRAKLNQDYLAGRTILPPTADIFRIFGLLPLDQVKVVILGQDPYHGLGQAHGLSFSVPTGVRLPPSLVNIYHEIQSDCQVNMNMQDGDLTYLMHQGVLLLNASLTVLAGQANSHVSYGRHTLTDQIISHISTHCDHVVYLLRGNFAKKKVGLIDQTKHTILSCAHPSPLSAYQGFIGCRHFSQCNADLQSYNKTKIQWSNVAHIK